MPDPIEQCAEGAFEAKTRRCVNGVWVEGWTAVSEFGGTMLVSSPDVPCGGKCECAKKDVIALAREQKWKPGDLVKALNALNGS